MIEVQPSSEKAGQIGLQSPRLQLFLS